MRFSYFVIKLSFKNKIEIYKKNIMTSLNENEKKMTVIDASVFC